MSMAVGCGSNKTDSSSGSEATADSTAQDGGEEKEQAASGSSVSASTGESIEYNALDYVTLGEYKGIEVTETVQAVTEGSIKTAIENALEDNKEKKETKKDTVEDGDIVNIDYKGTKDGVAFDGGTAEGYDLTIGSHSFIDGFEDGLIGAKVGKTVKLNLTFPEDYASTDLAGQDVVFEVKVNSIMEEIKPEYNDEFVQNISDFKTTKEYEEYLKETLTTENESEAENTMKTELQNTVKENAEFKGFPEGLVESEVQKYKDSMEKQIQASYGMALEDYIKEMGTTEDEFNEEITSYMKENVETEMLVKAIAETEGIEVTEDDYQKQLEEDLKSYGNSYGFSTTEDVEKYLNENGGVEEYKYSMLFNKVWDYVAENAKITKRIEGEEK